MFPGQGAQRVGISGMDDRLIALAQHGVEPVALQNPLRGLSLRPHVPPQRSGQSDGDQDRDDQRVFGRHALAATLRGSQRYGVTVSERNP